MKTYNILEIANVHAGSVEYMHKLLDEYAEFIPLMNILFKLYPRI